MRRPTVSGEELLGLGCMLAMLLTAVVLAVAGL